MKFMESKNETRISMKLTELKNEININKYIYIMALPVLTFYFIFHYIPMYGAVIAFKDFAPRLGIMRSEWAGFKHFVNFFQSVYFGRVLINTIVLNAFQLIFEFPAPIILALLLNEVKNKVFKRTIQTTTYLPHFISLVVICGMIQNFVATDGVINSLISLFGGQRSNLLVKAELFRVIYVISEVWQHIGWGSIIYLAALSGIDQELYEAAEVDGAGRFRKLFHITIPGIAPTIIILLILRMGRMMSVGFEKIILLYNPMTYETADVISSYVYRKGLLDFDYSFSTAVGLFNSAINFLFLLTANHLSKKYSESSLW